MIASDGLLDDITPDENGCILYFAYGSNLWEAQVVQRVGHVACIYPACLLDYELVFNKAAHPDAAYANIQPKNGSVVMGKVYCLSLQQLAVMDYYEGAPTHYSRREMGAKVFCESGDAERVATSTDYGSIRKRGVLRKCAVYIANIVHRTESPQRPNGAYLRKLLSGGPLVPKWYASWLASHDTCPTNHRSKQVLIRAE